MNYLDIFHNSSSNDYNLCCFCFVFSPPSLLHSSPTYHLRSPCPLTSIKLAQLSVLYSLEGLPKASFCCWKNLCSRVISILSSLPLSKFCSVLHFLTIYLFSPRLSQTQPLLIFIASKVYTKPLYFEKLLLKVRSRGLYCRTANK